MYGYPANKISSIGAGIHVVMNAKTALELGASIRGILAFDSTSTSVFLQTQSFSSVTKPGVPFPEGANSCT
jgi:hypothetical protein